MKAVRKVALAVALASGASAATADPLTELFFSQNAGWADPVLDYNGGGTLSFSNPTGAGAPANTFQTMGWTGADAGESSITITSFDSDSTLIRFDETLAADGDGEWNEGDIWVLDSLVQTNNVLFGGPFPNPLWIADTMANLRIYDDAVGGNAVLEDLNSDVEIRFWETLNTEFPEDGSPSCASPSPLFDAGVVTLANGRSACDDIYTVALEDFAPIQFVQDGYFYTINFLLLNGEARDNNGDLIGPTLACFQGNPFQDPLCNGAGVTPANGDIAVYTPESAPGTTSIFVAAFWEATPVPSPTALGLMGIGLASFGIATRRRKV